MLSILHISDLHRSASDPITNTELISSLLTDRDGFSRETPPVPPPNVFVVSGDLVQGVPLDSPDYPGVLEEQYDTALALLEELSNRFVGGDHARVILIPGNHDVDWNAARAAMVKEAAIPGDVRRRLSSPNSPYRWDWSTRDLLRILDRDAYEERLAYYQRLFDRFYGGATLAYPVDPKRYYNLFELNAGHVVVAAFNSCANNDCFSDIGEIPLDAIAQSHIDLRDSPSRYRLKIAVWHHSVSGAPSRTDFMNPETVDILISKGFRLGLHGHQHRADATPYDIHVAGDQRMAVVSAGSLCAGRYELPPGTQRQYNVIHVNDDYSGATVHVREMTLPNIFTAGRLTSLGGRSFVRVNWTPDDGSADLGAISVPHASLVIRAEASLRGGDPDAAYTLLAPISAEMDSFGRRLLLEACYRSRRWREVIGLVREPRNADELMKIANAHVALGDPDAAARLVDQYWVPTQLSRSQRNELLAWIRAHRNLRA